MSSGGGPYPRSFVFLLVPQFSLMPFTSAVEPLRVANRMHGRPVYSWRTASVDGAPVSASNGAVIHADTRLADLGACDAIVVCGGIDVGQHIDPATYPALRRFARRGSLIGSVCTGSILLAQAGLLDGHRCTVHWEEIDSLAENFPAIKVTRSLYEIDGQRFTCSGGTAPLDLMLHFIEEDFGRELGTLVADQMVHHSARTASQPQRLALSERTGVRHPALLEIIAQMEGNLETLLPLAQLAKIAKLSLRQVERLFASELGIAPMRYYRDLRLARARQLVRQTGMTMIEIAVATGFSSPAHFARAYRQRHGLPPLQDRGVARANIRPH